MHVIFKVWLDYQGGGARHHSTYARKALELPTFPWLGMELEDPAWRDWRPVENVVLSLDQTQARAHAYLGAIDCGDLQGFEQMVTAHRDSGWEICCL